MRQPRKNNSKKTCAKAKPQTVPKTRHGYCKKPHPSYGTSKLEEDFARDFLDKLNLEYTYQFEAKDIGRFFDFYVQGVLIEIDGDYYHSNPLLYEDKDLNRMQRKNKKVDEYKNTWALTHGFPILRIWENDIRHNPSKVMKLLEETFYKAGEKQKIYRKDVNVTPRKNKTTNKFNKK